MRFDFRIEGFSSEKITLDGEDSTSSIIKLCKRFPAKNITAILLNGVTFGGMNIADLDEVARATEIPVISVVKKYPSIQSMYRVIDLHHGSSEEKRSLLEKLRPISIKLDNEKSVYVNLSGITAEQTAEILSKQCILNSVPEAIRISHLIGSAIRYGISKGRA